MSGGRLWASSLPNTHTFVVTCVRDSKKCTDATLCVLPHHRINGQRQQPPVPGGKKSPRMQWYKQGMLPWRKAPLWKGRRGIRSAHHRLWHRPTSISSVCCGRSRHQRIRASEHTPALLCREHTHCKDTHKHYFTCKGKRVISVKQHILSSVTN